MAFKSARISRTSVLTLNAPLPRVFPLFGPIKEKEWAEGWDPHVLYSTTGLVEEHMVFQVCSPHALEADSTWTVSKYQPDLALIEYTVFAPERLWWITIQCRESHPGGTTEAAITYTHIGLTENGNRVNEQALAKMYHRKLKDWEEAINHYLATGKRLAHG
jgi:hypothetical protein